MRYSVPMYKVVVNAVLHSVDSSHNTSELCEVYPLFVSALFYCFYKVK
jgi:hypothetical protein